MDQEFAKQFTGKMMVPDPEMEKFMKFHPADTNWAETPEKPTSNTFINFGPQHPAAHGVLRLVMDQFILVARRSVSVGENSGS